MGFGNVMKKIGHGIMDTAEVLAPQPVVVEAAPEVIEEPQVIVERPPVIVEHEVGFDHPHALQTVVIRR